jgi:hypothetical protein
MSYNGRPYALEHDLCICRCSPPPRLIANQDHQAQLIEDADGMDEALEAIAAQVPVSAAREDAVPLQLIRESDDAPFRNRHYVLELPGRTIEGVTNSEGFTKPLTAAERAALIAWHVAQSP